MDFGSVGRGTILVLDTLSLPVRFKVIDRTEEQVQEWQIYPPLISDAHSNDIDVDLIPNDEPASGTRVPNGKIEAANPVLLTPRSGYTPFTVSGRPVTATYEGETS